MKNVRIAQATIIPGFEDYAATADGKIISLKFGKQKELKQTVGTNGYLNVGLSMNGISYTKSVHSLIAHTFVRNSNPKKNRIVNHLDRDKMNNSASNLEWTDHKGNAIHAVKTPKPKKSNSINGIDPNSVLKFLFDEIDFDTFQAVYDQVK